MAWVIDTSHSLVEFSVKHMMITTVRGRFNSFNATLEIDEANPQLSSLEGSVDTSSVDTRDPNRDAHLRSADFFDAEKYPVMTFRMRSIESNGSDRYRVLGELTIKDVTREVAFDVTDDGKMKDPWGRMKWGLTAQTTLNRKEFGLNWNVALEAGGWLVGDLVKVTLEMQLLQQVESAEPAAAGATSV